MITSTELHRQLSKNEKVFKPFFQLLHMNCQQYLELRANAIIRNRTWLIPSIMYYYNECKKGRLSAMEIESTVSMIADELFADSDFITV